MYALQHCFICRPSDFTVSDDAGIEPRTVVTLALTARCTNNSARYYPQLFQISSTNSDRSHPRLFQIPSTSRLDLICTRLDLSTTRLDLIHNSARFDPQLGQAHLQTRLDLIYDSSRSHQHLGQISSAPPISHPLLGQILSTTRLDFTTTRLAKDKQG